MNTTKALAIPAIAVMAATLLAGCGNTKSSTSPSATMSHDAMMTQSAKPSDSAMMSDGGMMSDSAKPSDGAMMAHPSPSADAMMSSGSNG